MSATASSPAQTARKQLHESASATPVRWPLFRNTLFICHSQPLMSLCLGLLQVLGPIVHSGLQSRSLQKPILVITITDGGSNNLQKDCFRPHPVEPEVRTEVTHPQTFWGNSKLLTCCSSCAKATLSQGCLLVLEYLTEGCVGSAGLSCCPSASMHDSIAHKELIRDCIKASIVLLFGMLP